MKESVTARLRPRAGWPREGRRLGGIVVLLLLASVSGLAAQALDLQGSPTANAEKHEDVAVLSRIAAGAGVDVTVLGHPPLARLPSFSEASDPSTALEFLRGKHFDRVEVYGGKGELQKLVSVARVSGEGGAPTPEAAAFRSRASAAARGSNRSLPDALAVARDRSAARAERQRAIAALARSGSEAAVHALRETIVDEEDAALSALAISALGGFAGTPAADAAQGLIAELRDLGIGDAAELAGAQAAHDVSPLIGEFQSIGDSHQRKRFMHAVARAGSGPDFVDFMLAALGDTSVTIRNAAVIQAMRSGDLLSSQQITQALEKARSDPMRRVRAAAAKALYYRENRSAIEAHRTDRETPIPRVDENPIIPGS